MPPARCTSSMCTSGRLGETLQMLGVAAEISFSRSRSNGMPAECASASACSTVLVEPPMAMSQHEGVISACSGDDVERADVLLQAALQRVRGAAVQLQALGVELGGARPRVQRSAGMVPLPGSARPSTSPRQFMELAVNMPAQLPQPGQARSARPRSSRFAHLAGAVLADAFEDGDQVGVAAGPPASARRSRTPPGC